MCPHSIEGLQQTSHKSCWSSKNSSNSAKVPQKRTGWHALLFRKPTHPLKIDGWKLKFALQMVPFLETFVHFRRVITVTFGLKKIDPQNRNIPINETKKTEVHPWDNPFFCPSTVGSTWKIRIARVVGGSGSAPPLDLRKKTQLPLFLGVCCSSFASWTGEFSSYNGTIHYS